jgi:hypothetical protein
MESNCNLTKSPIFIKLLHIRDKNASAGGSFLEGWWRYWLVREVNWKVLHVRSLEDGSSMLNMVHLVRAEHEKFQRL